MIPFGGGSTSVDWLLLLLGSHSCIMRMKVRVTVISIVCGQCKLNGIFDWGIVELTISLFGNGILLEWLYG